MPKILKLNFINFQISEIYYFDKEKNRLKSGSQKIQVGTATKNYF